MGTTALSPLGPQGPAWTGMEGRRATGLRHPGLAHSHRGLSYPSSGSRGVPHAVKEGPRRLGQVDKSLAQVLDFGLPLWYRGP